MLGVNRGHLFKLKLNPQNANACVIPRILSY